MRWRNLLFAHWPIDVAELRPLIPKALEIDTFDGQAWIGIVPFHLTIRYRWMPWSLSFPEVNVRTYVKRGGKSAVWFLSLDAHSRLAVTMARRQYVLPYHLARMRMRSEGDVRVLFASQRRSESNISASLDMVYRPIGKAFEPHAGTLEYWLTERYSLFASRPNGHLAFGQIDHRPWRLQPAEADFTANTMFKPLRIATPSTTPLLHFSRSIDAVAWRLGLWEVNGVDNERDTVESDGNPVVTSRASQSPRRDHRPNQSCAMLK
jgi:uncharacterized protein YqjF (DUF2071 family)